MRWCLRMVLLSLVATALSGCRTVPVAGECPETVGQPCLTQRLCAYDEKRDCQKCVCEGAWESDPVLEDQRMRGPQSFP